MGMALKQRVGFADSPNVWVLGTNSSGQSQIYVLDPTTLATVRTITPYLSGSGMTFRGVVPYGNFVYVSESNGSSGMVNVYRRDGINLYQNLSGGPNQGDCGMLSGTISGSQIVQFGGGSGGSAFNTGTLTNQGSVGGFDEVSVYDAGTNLIFSYFKSSGSIYNVYQQWSPVGAATNYGAVWTPPAAFPSLHMFQASYNNYTPNVVSMPPAVNVGGTIYWVGRGQGYADTQSFPPAYDGDGIINLMAKFDPSTFNTTVFANPTHGNGQPNNTSNSTSGQIMNSGICYNSDNNTIYVSYPCADKVAFANGRVDSITPGATTASTVISSLNFDNTTTMASCASAGNVLWFCDGVGKVQRVDLTGPTITATVTLLPAGGNVNPHYTNLAGGIWYTR